MLLNAALVPHPAIYGVDGKILSPVDIAKNAEVQRLARDQLQNMKKNKKRTGIFELLSDYRKEYLTVGSFVSILSMARAGIDIMLPLSCLAIGMTVDHIGYISSIAYFTGASLFPVSGFLMDRYGRKLSGTLALIFMAFGFMTLVYANSFLYTALAGVL